MGAGERHTVVGANGFREAEFFEHPLEHGEGVDLLGGRERLAGKQVAAGKVTDGERIAIALIGEHELAFVIGAPQIIRQNRPGQVGALRLVASFATTIDQAVAIKYRMHRANRRRLDIAMYSLELLAHVGRAPARSLALELNDQLFDLTGQPVSVPVGPSTAIGESVEPAVLIALVDLVAGLARDIELAAQRRHLLAIEQPRYQSE